MGILNLFAALFCIGRAGTETVIRDGQNANYMKKVRESGQKTYHDDRGRCRWTATGELCYVSAWKDGSYKIISQRTGRVLWDKASDGFQEDKKEFESRTDRFTIRPIKCYSYMSESKYCKVGDVFLIDKEHDNMIVIPCRRKKSIEVDGRFHTVIKYYLSYYTKNDDPNGPLGFLKWKIDEEKEITKEEYDNIYELLKGFHNQYNFDISLK